MLWDAFVADRPAAVEALTAAVIAVASVASSGNSLATSCAALVTPSTRVVRSAMVTGSSGSEKISNCFATSVWKPLAAAASAAEDLEPVPAALAAARAVVRTASEAAIADFTTVAALVAAMLAASAAAFRLATRLKLAELAVPTLLNAARAALSSESEVDAMAAAAPRALSGPVTTEVRDWASLLVSPTALVVALTVIVDDSAAVLAAALFSAALAVWEAVRAV